MYEIMSDLDKYLVNRYALCLKGSNMPRPPLIPWFISTRHRKFPFLFENGCMLMVEPSVCDV